MRSREHTNFTYDLNALNVEHLAWWVSTITGAPPTEIRGYITEIDGDAHLKSNLHATIEHNRGIAGLDPVIRYSRRVGWYAIVRAMRPALVVETGVEKGLGTMTIAAALRKNAQDGVGGRLVAIDIEPTCGALIQPPYDDLVDLRIGDSIDELERLSGVDIFIHDSDHSAEHERRELEAIEHRLAAGAIVLSDNSHVTDELPRFAERTGRHFLFFDERPEDHWYPGGGIGAAYLPTGAREPRQAPGSVRL